MSQLSSFPISEGVWPYIMIALASNHACNAKASGSFGELQHYLCRDQRLENRNHPCMAVRELLLLNYPVSCVCEGGLTY